MVLSLQVTILLYFSHTININFYRNDIFLEILKRVIAENIKVADSQRMHIKYWLAISSGYDKNSYRSFKLCNNRDV